MTNYGAGLVAGTSIPAPASGVNAGAVQPTTPKDQKSAFVPRFETNDKRAQMKLGEIYPHEVWVTNSSTAVPGTTYHWAHSVAGPSHRAIDTPDQPVLKGPSTFYPFELRGVGIYKVGSKLQYGVGEDLHEARTGMEVVVDKITQHETAIVTEKDGRKRPFEGSMLVGEDLVIKTSMNDLQRAGHDPVESVRAHVMVPGLDFRGITAITHCELVLTGLGGQVRAELIGTAYDAFSAATGARCGEGAGYCKQGDLCVSAGTCEVVLSAWMP